MPKNSYKLVNELSRSQRFRRFRKYNENNSNIISCITSSSNSDITFSNLTNTSQETSKSIPITSNSINQCNKHNLNNLNEDLDLSDNFEFDTSYSSSGDELNDDECIHNYDNQNKLCYELQKWVLNKCIPANAVTSLLKILCSCNPSDVLTLPKDVRTLMKTPRLALVTKKVGDYGEYTHFGLESGLRNKWLKYSKTILKNVHDFQVYINFDGLPIHKSSSGSLWPISCAS
ncbi:unnamed protein product [Macrosiphum euphorbiae]|uniref:Uncharacterized protein n=1 Tax=Macrosiphum euphorbiae TaxID=13131 RepID=A0AAV0WAK5_9HEMI|nr:unnamed protein product [Macrosiphum euphorbiae]